MGEIALRCNTTGRRKSDGGQQQQQQEGEQERLREIQNFFSVSLFPSCCLCAEGEEDEEEAPL